MIIEHLKNGYTILRERGLFDKRNQKSLLVLERDMVFVAAGTQKQLHREYSFRLHKEENEKQRSFAAQLQQQQREQVRS